jgi:hypothetical protein
MGHDAEILDAKALYLGYDAEPLPYQQRSQKMRSTSRAREVFPIPQPSLLLRSSAMIFFVTGASGSGKTACMPHLDRLLPQVRLYDFDAVGVPPHAGAIWRQQTTEYWLRQALVHQMEPRDTLVCGGAVLGEILACPSASQVNGIAVCLLDCADVVRIDRLRARSTHGATQDMLNWAAWQRLHAVDPQWRPDVIQRESASDMQWARWQRGDPRWQVRVLDTTTFAPEEVAAQIASWVHQQRAAYAQPKNHT